MNTTSPARCPAWRKLKAHAASRRGARPGTPFVAVAPGVRLDYSLQRIDRRALELLAQLAAERGFAEWRAALFAGKAISATEGRAARHMDLRAGASAPAEVKSTLLRMKDLSIKIRSENTFKRMINLGIGGSDLGPRLVADAFGDGGLDVRFVANADPLELERALAGAEPVATLVVVVSKSFSTQETLLNAKAARRLGCRTFYAVTANPAAARQFGVDEILPVWDWVGGRFSVWSAAGFSAMCAIGVDAFEEFLSGANEMDRHFFQEPIEKNVPALLGLLGVWNINFLGAGAHAVLPYAHRLRLLPAWLQQLEMESNGKSVDREGRPVGYATCPVVFGAEGTPAQHSFMQHLHQGTQAVPADFIDFSLNDFLSANARAQAAALASGTGGKSLPPHRRHSGKRPSSTLQFDTLDARNLGRLLALYEHKVFTQGVIWNLDSFDQWGVELGKNLARKILKGGK